MFIYKVKKILSLVTLFLVIVQIQACNSGSADEEFGIIGGGGIAPTPVAPPASPENNCSMGSLSPITVSGQATFDRVPLKFNGGLDFNNTTRQAIKSAQVNVVCGSVVTTTSTDENGNYSFAIAGGTTGLVVRIKAQSIKTGVASWDVAVLDQSQVADLIFAMDSLPFNISTSNITKNLNAASGWDGLAYTGTRVAAPFAMLDTVYSAMQLVLAVDSTVAFPALKIKWSESSAEGTYYTNNIISVIGREADTDEFDQHVIAHEWGHYFQDAFSRDDSIGGAHTSGDILDPRVAFSEGFGNALSAMVTGDAVYKDSASVTLQTGFTIDVEYNDCQKGGWFSECSVQAILYDIYDTDNEGFDVINLGFSPIYRVLTDSIPQTRALTTLFSFITPLKQLPSISATDVDSLARDFHGIAPITDDIGTGRVLNPGLTNQLPVYTTRFPAILCSTGENGGYNGLGVFRFMQFMATSTGRHEFIATRVSGNDPTDPDLYLVARGELIELAESFDINTESLTANLVSGNIYVLELQAYKSYGSEDYEPSAPGAINETCFSINKTP